MKERIDNIYNKIAELADLNLQRKLWLNEENNTGFISSYVELICSLFDDFNFADFIDITAPKIDLSNTFFSELNKLRDLLNKYHEKESDLEIINDPEWRKIVEQANIVLKMWHNFDNLVNEFK
ncbi:MAG: hypothetical protein H7321_02500 [Bacteroidia bacterium]|nr:hypothetical protein [Bacteroidia bacterium]